MNVNDDEREIAELKHLPRTTAPPAELEERVVAALRARGLVAAPGRRERRLALAAACLVAALGGWFARGLASPATPSAPATAPGDEFLLLLSEPGPLHTSKPTAELVAEYRAWSIGLANEGRLAAAGKLAATGRLLAGSATGRITEAPGLPGDPVTGFFVVRADDLAAATELARTCPHLAYGGVIRVRPLERLRGSPPR